MYDHPLLGLTRAAADALLHDEARGRGANALLEITDIEADIFETTHGMPLAIKLVVTQFLLGISIEDELQRLRGVTQERDIYEFIYFSVWQQLSLPAQKVLVWAATFGSSARREDLLELSAELEDVFDRVVTDLMRYSLMHTRYALEQQRYEVHSMTRWFVNNPLEAMYL